MLERTHAATEIDHNDAKGIVNAEPDMEVGTNNYKENDMFLKTSRCGRRIDDVVLISTVRYYSISYSTSLVLVYRTKPKHSVGAGGGIKSKAKLISMGSMSMGQSPKPQG